MRPFISLCAILVLGACGEDAHESNRTDGSGTSVSTAKDSGGGASHHGAIVGLGVMELGGERFAVARHGPCLPGKEGAFVVTKVGSGSATSLFLWVEDAGGEAVSAPARGERSGDDFHFHVLPHPDSAAPTRVVLRLREGGIDERAGLDLQVDAAPLHDGVAAPLQGRDGAIAGWLELKLHDDKGDLELWLWRDAAMSEPFDLSLDSVPTATFLSASDRRVELRVRNAARNEDEEGKANVRGGLSNYFIFPGDSGADPSWLQGADFRSLVRVTLPSPKGPTESIPFQLRPHGGGAAGHHH